MHQKCLRWSASALVAGVASSAIATAAANADIIVIDDFSDSTFLWTGQNFEPGTSPTITETGINVLGGQRQTTLTLESAGLEGVDFVQSGVFPNAGVLDFVSSTQASGSLNLNYFGEGFGMGIDFSGQAGIVLDMLAYDAPAGQPMPITVSLSDGMTSASLTENLTFTGAGGLFFDFASFQSIDMLSLSTIQSIEVFFNPPSGGDFRANMISTVIPGPGGLAALALAGVMTTRRRRRT